MRDIKTIAVDIIAEIENQSHVELGEEHVLYNTFISMLTHQSDLLNAIIVIDDDRTYEGWIHFIGDKYIRSFRPISGIIPPNELKIIDLMRSYIIENQLQVLGGTMMQNEHVVDICLTFQVYSMKNMINGFASTVINNDRGYIAEMCKSAIKNYTEFIQDISIHTNKKMGKMIV